MNIGFMRNVLKNCTIYSHSEQWRERVDNMSDNQVIAVYMSMSKQGRGIIQGLTSNSSS